MAIVCPAPVPAVPLNEIWLTPYAACNCAGSIGETPAVALGLVPWEAAFSRIKVGLAAAESNKRPSSVSRMQSHVGRCGADPRLWPLRRRAETVRAGRSARERVKSDKNQAWFDNGMSSPRRIRLVLAADRNSISSDRADNGSNHDRADHGRGFRPQGRADTAMGANLLYHSNDVDSYGQCERGPELPINFDPFSAQRPDFRPRGCDRSLLSLTRKIKKINSRNRSSCTDAHGLIAVSTGTDWPALDLYCLRCEKRRRMSINPLGLILPEPSAVSLRV